MENVKKYVLYLGKHVKPEYTEQFVQVLDNLNVDYEVINLDNEFDEASKSISSNGVALFCYFVNSLNEEITGTPDATKVYENGFGKGIGLLNRNLNTYLYQFQNEFTTMNEVVANTINKINSSINWCENHLSVNY